MNPVIIVAIDTLANSFDECNIKVAPIVTIEFQTERDLYSYLGELGKELAVYSKNGVVVPIVAGEINKFNDVLCVFKLRSN